MTRRFAAARIIPAAPVTPAIVDGPAPWRPEFDPELLCDSTILTICRSRERISVGLTISVPGRAPETIAATDDIAIRADWLQQQFQQGPVILADGRQVVVSRDLAADRRWPDFGRMSVAVLGLRSVVAIEVPMPGIRASLNFYSAQPSAFDNFDVDAALRLARLAAPSAQIAAQALRETHAGTPHTDASQLAIALATVMAQHRVAATDGFDLLRDEARSSRRPLFAVAMAVVRNGGLPEAITPGSGHRQPERTPARPGHAATAAPEVGGPEMWRTPAVLSGHSMPLVSTVGEQQGVLQSSLTGS